MKNMFEIEVSELMFFKICWFSLDSFLKIADQHRIAKIDGISVAQRDTLKKNNFKNCGGGSCGKSRK